MRGRRQIFPSDESGALSVVMTVMLTAILFMAALVIDLGHLHAVRSEVRKAAEAGAYAGVRALRLGVDPAVLDWDNGKNMAVSAVRLNAADNRSLADFTVANVQAGYWDTTWIPATTPANLLGYADPASFVPTDFQVPAVKVTVTKTQGGTGSNAPVSTFFASMMGYDSLGAQATTTAILPTPRTIPPGNGFPLATPESWAQRYYDSDPPFTFRIGDTYHNPDGGQWTTFEVDQNNVPYVRKLIDNGNPNELSIGDNIWIEPGVKDTLYGYAASKIDQTVMLPVVCDDFETHAWTPIVNFVAFNITDAHQGSDPYIEGHFVKNWTNANGSGAGNHYLGTSLPPKLVQ